MENLFEKYYSSQGSVYGREELMLVFALDKRLMEGDNEIGTFK